MTAGIVSAKGRDLPQENLVPFIQTDVAINPGNSGGPLFNMRGEVVGINSLIYSRTGGFMGLAFAVPIDVAMNAVKQLKDKGRVTRGRIGVQIQELTKEAADAFGLKQADGALVNNVEKDGPAAKAGIESGDIILKVDGRDVHSSNDLPRIITRDSTRHEGDADRVAQGRSEGLCRHRRRNQGRRDAAATARQSRAEGEGEAQSHGARAVGPDRRAAQASSASRAAACWSRTSSASCAATCRPAT